MFGNFQEYQNDLVADSERLLFAGEIFSDNCELD